MTATLAHVQYATAAVLSEDDLTWLPAALGIPEGLDCALVCVTTEDGPLTYRTEDLNYALMLDEAMTSDLGAVTLTPHRIPGTLTFHRQGWPEHWLGFGS